MTMYSIRDWAIHFENNRTRDMVKMSWVPVPNKHDGEGFQRIMRQADGIKIYGCWHLILQVASKCLRGRGTLVRDDGTPLTAEAIALKTGWRKSADIQRALDFLSSPDVAWIDKQDTKNHKFQKITPKKEEIRPQGAAIPQEGAAIPQEGAAIPQVARARRNGIEGNRITVTCGSFKNLDRDGSEDFKKQIGNPGNSAVNLAMQLCQEERNNAFRGFLSGARSTLGDCDFRQEISTFAAELAAGENVRNKGAALTARLKRLILAKK